jgi:CDP-glucose 4,6-dehydratase
MAFRNFYQGKRVFVTGHTGFKGSWLCEWLLALGADVRGYALDPQPHELLYEQLGLGTRLAGDTRADLRDAGRLQDEIARFQPQVVFHLAAQPLVQLSYDLPVATFETNVIGTVNLLESLRQLREPCRAVCITTDKCYDNKEWLYGYREVDAMGGHDPYSASKGCAEIAIASYRRSFFDSGHPVTIASARAGNVIGGGDWAKDRIIPDCFRALARGEVIPVRNKTATRPWQHVLEPLSGYLLIPVAMAGETDPGRAAALSEGINFGPNLSSNRTVAQLVAVLLKHAPGDWVDQSNPDARHEASKLNLAIDKAYHLLEWQPVWNFAETLAATAMWYLENQEGNEARDLCQAQIRNYTECAHQAKLPWTLSTT